MFQAKTEMGIDLGEVLASQACAELSYEIDTEIVNLLTDNAIEFEDLTWNKTRPIGVNLRDHYESFAAMIQKASQHIYDATQKYRANYLIVASDLIPVLTFVTGFKATDKIGVGPYFAGSVNGVKVFVSPVLTPGTYVAGFNGDDMVTSAAVFAPYMAIVPTQLLGYADGSMSQGFSSLYDVKLLNKYLIVKGKVVELPDDIHIAG